jgi:5-hydroxyisourate hydrolase-like protein (transthyretin family)
MKLMRRITVLSVTAVLAVVVMMGANCNGLIPQGSGNPGSLRVLLTDKPFPFEFIQSAVVTLTRVEVCSLEAAENEGINHVRETADPDQLAAAQPVGIENANGDGDGYSNWITVFEDSAGKEFDLVDLRNGRTNLLADAELPAGAYNQMRLVVSGGQVTLTDGRTFPLTVPSGDTSGIKLHFSFDVVEGQQTDLLLDVDLSRAFLPIPGGHVNSPDGIRQFHFQPSLAMRLINLLHAGSISGMVTDSTTGAPIGGAAVTAYDGDTEVTSTSTDADGTYKLTGLTTGTYRVEFSADGYVDAEVADVSVTAGQESTGINAALTAAQP